jgi:glutamyl-Q tRNA(Asp) synthetase
VDDAEQGVTEVVRGADLLASTPRQILLQRALALPTPQYCHLPLAVDREGRKLSKSCQSLAINTDQTVKLLWLALDFLRQAPPKPLQRATTRDIWGWARENWQIDPLRGLRQQPAPPPQDLM